MKNTITKRTVRFEQFFTGSNKMVLREVSPVQPYHPDWKNRATQERVLIAQYKFPSTYSDKDVLLEEKIDTYSVSDAERLVKCLVQYSLIPELCYFEWWVQEISSSHPPQVLAYLQELLSGDPRLKWTGYRVTGSILQTDGEPRIVWTLELFAKHPESETRVFSERAVCSICDLVHSL